MIKTIITSSVAAAIVSGFISIITAKISNKHFIKSTHENRKYKLLLDSFNIIQSRIDEIERERLVMIEKHNAPQSDDSTILGIIACQATNQLLGLISSTLDKLSCLIPDEKTADLHKEYFSLLTYSLDWDVPSYSAVDIENIDSVSCYHHMDDDQYFDMLELMVDSSILANNLKKLIATELRNLCSFS